MIKHHYRHVYFILLLTGLIISRMVALPTFIIDSQFWLYLVLSFWGGLWCLKALFWPSKRSISIAIMSAAVLSFVTLLFFTTISANYVQQGMMGKLVQHLAIDISAKSMAHGFFLMVTYGLSPVLIYYGLKQACPCDAPKIAYYPKTLLRFFYLMPLLVYVVIISGFVYKHFIKPTHDPLFAYSFLIGSILLFAAPMMLFYIPSMLLYLKTTRQQKLRHKIDVARLIKTTLIPQLVILPLIGFIYLKNIPIGTNIITSEDWPILLRFLYLPMAVMMLLALSFMRKRRRSAYAFVIILTGLFVLLNFTLVSMVLAIIVIYYAAEEMPHANKTI